MSESFVSLITKLRDEMVGDLFQIEQEVAYLSAPERLREAEEAQPCVHRFADLEMNPPAGKAVGRGKGAKAPAIAGAMPLQFPNMDDADRDWLRDTVVASVAFGYVFFCAFQSGGQPPPPLGGDSRELWERWVLRIGSDALEKCIGKRAVDPFMKIPAMHLKNTMKKHELYKLSNAANLDKLTTLYPRAGATLRLLQSTKEYDVEPHRSQLKELPGWPFEPAGAAVTPGTR